MPQTQATMTEQEARVFEEKMTRIWEPLTVGLPYITPDVWLLYAVLEQGENLEVGLEVQEKGFHLAFFCEDTEAPELGGFYVSKDGVLTPTVVFYDRKQELVFNLTTKWLPLFRRGCWLSGCDIEATAHEKTEWMQKFSREELQSWNLKV